MVYMDIPYGLDDHGPLPDIRFKSIWKVHANNSYQVAKPQGFAEPGIFVTLEGEGLIAFSDTCFELHAGTYIIVPNAWPCSYRCVNDDWKFYFIHFEPLDMAIELELPIGQPVSTVDMPEAVRLCERLIDSLIVHPKGYRYMAHLITQQLLLLLAKDETAIESSRCPELDDILYQMHKNIGRMTPIDDFVRQSGLSRTAFFARFRQRTGMSPGRYMQELKLASAKAALETTHSSVKEIAAALSFYDEFHFSKLFKQRYGVSPRAYRQGLIAGLFIDK